MKLKFKKGIPLSILLFALLSYGCCKNEDPISKSEKEAINKFNQDYFVKYNKTFIPNTDDENFKPSDLTFHTWAWQKYLHLTQNIKDNKASVLPLFLNDDSIHQINFVIGDDGNVEIEKYKKRKDKPEDPNLKLVLKEQAMAHAILKTNPSFSNGQSKGGETVYYSIHMNQLMIDDITKSVDKKVKDFINNPNNKESTDKNEKYTNGALELKAAWVDVKAIPEELRKDYLIVNDALLPDSTDKKPFAVALIGLHIVGMVDGFPELLWATFEGKHLAPDNMHNLTDHTSKDQYKGTPEENLVAKSEKEWMFYRKGNTKKENQDSVINYMAVLNNNEYANQVYRKHPLSIDIKHFDKNASTTSKSFVRHANLINAMNINALEKPSITMTYNGNIWLIGKPKDKLNNLLKVTFKPSKLNESLLAGSPNAVNITMETYGQNTQCFSCHGGKKTIKKLKGGDYTVETIMNTSHIYSDYLAGRIKYEDLKNNKTTQIQSDKKIEPIIDYIEKIKREDENKVQNN